MEEEEATRFMRGDYAALATKQGPETTLRELHPRNRGDMEPRNAMWPSVTLAAHMSAPAFQTGCLTACLPGWLAGWLGCFDPLLFVPVHRIIRLPSPVHACTGGSTVVARLHVEGNREESRPMTLITGLIVCYT